jgi:hypothetical protein
MDCITIIAKWTLNKKSIFFLKTYPHSIKYEMKLAIAILNWNGKKLLQRFLPSVIQNSPEANVFIIDNGSNDESQNYIKQNYPEVDLIQLDSNFGFAGGYNRGLKKIDAELVCLLNNDVMVKEKWLPPILYHFRTNPKTAIAQPHILNLNRPEYFEYAGAAGGFIDRLGYPYCNGRVFHHIEKDNGQYILQLLLRIQNTRVDLNSEYAVGLSQSLD